MKKVNARGLLVLFAAVVFSFLLSFCAFAIDTSFEAEIKDFPESYKPYLRELHEKYPEWSFVPMLTGLDWETVLDNEISKETNNKNDKKSLVDAGSSVSDIFKSTSSYDYNKSTGVYKQWDGGFVAANRLAVSYFMDPRNFLTEDNIFQFELLAFDERHTVEAIEIVLKGSFMSESVITYYDSEGNKKTLDTTYAEAIHEAGEKYNINPCYLASKILNEVGTNGSSSVSGKHSTYPGIYNFYNIGATDGSGAIARGLKWASSGSTYSRPWNTPVKSIEGGAEYLAATYIKNGQFTGYLQRFNVNPDAYYSLYTHQYMTNLTGALSQGYTTYRSYVKSGLLYNNYVFSIPVYENMPEGDGGTAYASDSIAQKGKINVSSSNVRTGASTYNAKLTDSNGNAVQLSQNTTVTILEKVETDTAYYAAIMQYPYWYKISFTYNSKTMTGYVPAGFVDITTKTVVPTGKYDLTLFKSDENVSLSIWSVDSSIAKVTDGDTVDFLKEGEATIVIYDSLGKMDKIVFSVTEKPSVLPVSDLSAEASSTKVKLTFTKNSDAKTELSILKQNGELIKTVTTAENSYTFKSLTLGEKYTVVARAVGEDGYSAGKAVSFALQPEKVTGLKYSADTEGNIVLSWNAVECTGYAVYCFNADTEKYTRMGTVKGSTTYTVPTEYKDVGTYCIKAYISFGGKNIYSELSDKLVTQQIPATPEGLTISNVSENGYKLSWNEIKNAEGYCVYSVDGENLNLVETLTDTSITFNSLAPGSAASYKVRAFRTSNGKTVYSEYSDTVTAVTMPKPATGLKSSDLLSDGVTLSWKAAEGATEYELYYKSGDELYSLLTVTENAAFDVTGLTENTHYTFSIVATAKSGETAISSKAAEVSVHTYFAPVENFSVAESDVTTAMIYWDENEKCSGYEIYRYNSKSKEYELFETVYTSSIEITDLVPATSYYFKVRAVGKKADGTVNYSALSEKLKVVTNVPKFESSFASSSVTDTSFKLSWEKADGAVSYCIYKYENEVYIKLASTSKTTYKLSKLNESDLSYYAVSAVYKFGSKSVESEKSDLFTASTKPSKVQKITATPKSGTVTLKWDAVKNASFYRVYLYDSAKKKYVAKKDVADTACTLSGLGYVKSHKVRVRAYIESDCSIAYSSLTQVDFTTLPKDIANVKLSSATKTAQALKWSKSSGATHYYVYRYDSSSKSYKRIATTTKTSYTVKGLKSGTTYTYKIKPVVLENGKRTVTGNATKAYKFSTK